MIPASSIRLVNLALAALLVLLAYDTVEKQLYPPSGKMARTKKQRKEESSAASGDTAYASYKVIEKVNIFKSKDIVRRKPTPTPVPPTPRPLPPLKMELKGTTTSRADGNVKAIIYDKKTRKTAAYSKDDVIPDSGGAKIVEITRDAVILERGGQTDNLQLYPEEVTDFSRGGRNKGSAAKPRSRGGSDRTGAIRRPRPKKNVALKGLTRGSSAKRLYNKR